MKQVFVDKGSVVVKDVPAPVCSDDGILVANKSSLISTGTEKSSIEKRSSLISLAISRPDLVKKVWEQVKKKGLKKTYDLVSSKIGLTPLGYSSAGTVVEVGKNVKEFSPGDRVACAGAGYANHAEYSYVPKNLAVKIPKNVSFQEAAFTGVGAIAMQAVRRADARIGDNVVVVGLGLVGLLTAQILKSAGCNVMGIDINPKKIRQVSELGLKGLDGRKNPVKEVQSITGNGADSVIITASSDNNKPLVQAIEMCRKKGRIVVVGDIPMNVPRDEFYEKELDMLMSTSYGPGRYDTGYEERGKDYPVAYVRWTENRNMQAFVKLLSKNTVDVKTLISEKYGIKQAPKAYGELNPDRIAVLFTYKTEAPEKSIEVNPKPRKKEKIGVALVGAGSISKVQHLPNLKDMDSYDLRAVVSNTPQNARQTAEKYGAEYAATDYGKVLKDRDIDMILISTRHNLHADMAIEAAKSGKDVFLEKPMALNEKELGKIIKAVKKNKVNFMVGFNRRFSPLSVKARESLPKGNCIINCVVNAGKLDQDSWIYDPEEGGGRIISECCHFFDLFNYFTRSRVKDIKVLSLPTKDEVLSEDNIAVMLKYENGSVANLIYSSIGNQDYPKERVTVFQGGAVAVIDDFRELNVYGPNKVHMKTRQDKGHQRELSEFAKTIRGKPSQKLTFDECVRATRTSLEVLKKAKKL